MNQVLPIIIASVAAAVLVALIAWLSIRPRHEQSKTPATPQPLPMPKLSAEKLAGLESTLEQRYAQIIEASTDQFSTELSQTSVQLNEQVKRLTTSVITTELDQYHQSLEKIRTQAIEILASLQTAVDKQRTQMANDLELQLEGEKQRLAILLDAKLTDIVTNFVLEALGSQVDLGAQGKYLLDSLEQHKDELKQELTSGA